MAMIESLTNADDESQGRGFAWPAAGVLRELTPALSPLEDRKAARSYTNGSVSHTNGSIGYTNGSISKKQG